MANVAIVEKCASNVNWDSYLNFPYQQFALCDTYKKKITKKDVTLSEDELSGYDYIITVGAEPTKYVAGVTSVTTYQGTLLQEKYLPIINPAMLRIRPEGERDFEKAVDKITKYVNGEVVVTDNVSIRGIEDTTQAVQYVDFLLTNNEIEYIAVDTETSALYPKDGYVLGISISHEIHQGVYINSDCIDEELENKLKDLFRRKICVFHNAKFDLKFLWQHFGFDFPQYHDTMILHYLLDENDSHGLKDLALKYTKLGNYDSELHDWVTNYCRQYKVKKADFTYDMIPFEILSKYAGYDTAATYELFTIFWDKVSKAPKLLKVYNEIAKPAIVTLAKIENNGIPFDKERLADAKVKIGSYLVDLAEEFYEFKEVKEFEKDTGKKFNPNSVYHLRDILYDRLGLPVLKYSTETDQPSTDKESLAGLNHPFAKLVLNYKKWAKIKSTYLDKIIAGLDNDGRLRTNLNQHVTTSGRLSSSGKINLQQFPRDTPVVKWSIRARPNWKIISQDLATAEMYVAAYLSKDSKLMSVFDPNNDVDFHSSIAKIVFKLECEAHLIKDEHKNARQAAKAISFGVLYGSGPGKVAEVTGLSIEEARDVISQYFGQFPKLRSWLNTVSEYIKQNGHIYSHYGRKRRLLNVTSKNSQIASHDVRSGVNFLIQSVASDINLIAAIKMQEAIEKQGSNAQMFALVHDSIVAEVPEDEIDWYNKTLKHITQYETGICIPGAPIGVDQEIGDDYAFGKGGESFVL
jgi:DNA polymerase I-like protein with 3'-5' exonuclease and polymerase domains